MRVGFCFVLLSALFQAPFLPAWEWSDRDSAVLPSLQEEYDKEVTSYQARVDKGLSVQERLIALDRLVSQYKPQGINTIVQESERDRLTVQLDQEQKKNQASQKISSELYQVAVQKTREGRFLDALSAIRKAERLAPEDRSMVDMRRKLEGITAILPAAVQATKADWLVRKGVVRYLENDAVRSLNALRYAQGLNPVSATMRLVKLVEKDYPGMEAPSLPQDKTLVDYKLERSLEYVYDSQYLKALEECNQVLDMDPGNVLALTRMGSVYYAMGQKPEARTFWDKALKLDPNNQVLRQFLNEKF